MKILDETNKVECGCGAVLQYDEKDIEDGYIVCPCCGEAIKVRKELKFPKDYCSFKDGVNLSNKDINKFVKDGIKYLRNNPIDDSYYSGTGNTMIFVFRNDGDEEFEIFVCKDYYEGQVEY